MIQVKRAYDPAARGDGTRFLVDRLWPRSVAPSNELRKWFGHDPARWDEFQRRYFAELDAEPEAWQPILKVARRGNVTLLYGARDTEHNNAVALKEYLEKQAL